MKYLITTAIWSNDARLFIEVINQGIDSHLEAFVKSRFPIENDRLCLDIHPDETHIFTRRLREIDTEQSNSWADDIEAIT